MAEFPYDPHKLDRYGFTVQEEETTDVCRRVWCTKSHHHIPGGFEFGAIVEYQKTLFDTLVGNGAENCQYSFIRVDLVIYRLEEDEESDKVRRAKVAKFEVSVSSRRELERLITMLWGRVDRK